MPLQVQQHNIGVISDTHGLLRPAVLQQFASVDIILHAGDIGGGAILETLETVAPTVAVKGNMDGGRWSRALEEMQSITVAGKRIFLVHDLTGCRRQPAHDAVDIVVSGHTHRPSLERHNGVLYLNPGAAGYGRHGYPASIARLILGKAEIKAELIDIA